MTHKTYIFECSSTTYMDCVEKNLFGSNKPWPMAIKVGDYCLLHHYEVGGLLGLWQAVSDGGKNLVPKIWGGKFPYQVRVKLVIPKVIDVPAKLLADLGVDARVGRFDNCVEEAMGEQLIGYFLGRG
jgi:Development and cell death domain